MTDPFAEASADLPDPTGDDWVWHATAQTWERTDGSGEAWTWDAASGTWRATGRWRWDDATARWEENPDWHGGLPDMATSDMATSDMATPDMATPDMATPDMATPTPVADASPSPTPTPSPSPAPTPAPSRGRGRHGRSRTVWIAAGLVVVAVVVGALALFPDVFGIGNPSDPQAYIPTTIDGKPVQETGRMLGIMQSAFVGGAKYRQGQVRIASGLVESAGTTTTTAPGAANGRVFDNRFPELVVMAVRRLDGPPLAPSLEKTLGAGADAGERVAIDGVPAKVYRNDSFGEGTVFVAATPRDDLVLLALAFAPSDEVIPDSAVTEARAISAIEAMLAEAGR